MTCTLEKNFTVERFEEGAIDPACFDDEDWPAFRARNAALINEFPRHRVP